MDEQGGAPEFRIAEAVVPVRVDTAAFERFMDEAERRVQALGDKVAAALGRIPAALAGPPAEAAVPRGPEAQRLMDSASQGLRLAELNRTVEEISDKLDAVVEALANRG